MIMKKYITIAIIVLLFLALGLFYLDRTPKPQPIAEKAPQKPPVQNTDYDLIVVGSDPEGIAAAVSGARNGLTTLLVDTRPAIGGLMTRGWLNTIDMNYNPKGEILNKGIFLEFFNRVEGDSFNVNTALNVFNQMVEAEPKLDVLLKAKKITPVLNAEQNAVTGVKLIDEHEKERHFNAKYVIDATQDGDIAAASGVPFSVSQEDMGYQERYMAVTLVYQLQGVSGLDWWRMGAVLLLDRLKGQHAGINKVSAWGFSEEMQEYQPTNEQVGVRGLNIGRQKDGTILINNLHVYEVNPLDKNDLAKAYRLAQEELPHIVEFLRKNIPGLENARLMATAPELYVRESRHIYGEYRLTVDDVLENRDFADAIAFGSYPIDIQAVNKDFKGAIVGVPKQYAIPLRCLIPQKIDGLMVVGRAASFDSLAHGSARVIPVGMATGQAAGAAAALSIEKNISVRDLAANQQLVDELRTRLNEQGMELEHFSYPAPETKHWAYEGLKFVRRYGLAFGGYDNNYRLDEEMGEQAFINLLSWTARLAGSDDLVHPTLYTEGNALTIKDISYMLTSYQGLQLTKEEAYQRLLNAGYFSDEVLQRIENNNGKITNGTAYMILRDFFAKGKVADNE